MTTRREVVCSKVYPKPYTAKIICIQPNNPILQNSNMECLTNDGKPPVKIETCEFTPEGIITRTLLLQPISPPPTSQQPIMATIYDSSPKSTVDDEDFVLKEFLTGLYPKTDPPPSPSPPPSLLPLLPLSLSPSPSYEVGDIVHVHVFSIFNHTSVPRGFEGSAYVAHGPYIITKFLTPGSLILENVYVPSGSKFVIDIQHISHYEILRGTERLQKEEIKKVIHLLAFRRHQRSHYLPKDFAPSTPRQCQIFQKIAKFLGKLTFSYADLFGAHIVIFATTADLESTGGKTSSFGSDAMKRTWCGVVVDYEPRVGMFWLKLNRPLANGRGYFTVSLLDTDSPEWHFTTRTISVFDDK